jgi:hypothetical protein
MYRFEDDRRRDGKVTVKLDCCGDHVCLGGTDGEISLSNALRWLLLNRPKAAQSPVTRVVGKQDQHFSDQLQQRVGNHLRLFGGQRPPASRAARLLSAGPDSGTGFAITRSVSWNNDVSAGMLRRGLAHDQPAIGCLCASRLKGRVVEEQFDGLFDVMAESTERDRAIAGTSAAGRRTTANGRAPFTQRSPIASVLQIGRSHGRSHRRPRARQKRRQYV